MPFNKEYNKSIYQARNERAALQREYNTLINRKNVLSTLFKGYCEFDDPMCV